MYGYPNFCIHSQLQPAANLLCCPWLTLAAAACMEAIGLQQHYAVQLCQTLVVLMMVLLMHNRRQESCLAGLAHPADWTCCLKEKVTHVEGLCTASLELKEASLWAPTDFQGCAWRAISSLL